MVMENSNTLAWAQVSEIELVYNQKLSRQNALKLLLQKTLNNCLNKAGMKIRLNLLNSSKFYF